MKKLSLLMVMALLFSVTVFSAPLKVSWTEGSVMIKTGNSWKDLDVGATVESSSLIRLKKDSFVEFSYAGTTLVLSTEGIYSLEKFLANGVKQEKERASIISKVGKIITHQAPLSTTVAGVRGSEQDSSPNMDWIIDEGSGSPGIRGE